MKNNLRNFLNKINYKDDLEFLCFGGVVETCSWLHGHQVIWGSGALSQQAASPSLPCSSTGLGTGFWPQQRAYVIFPEHLLKRGGVSPWPSHLLSSAWTWIWWLTLQELRPGITDWKWTKQLRKKQQTSPRQNMKIFRKTEIHRGCIITPQKNTRIVNMFFLKLATWDTYVTGWRQVPGEGVFSY